MAGAWVGNGLLRFQQEQKESRCLLRELQMHTGTALRIFSHPSLHQHMGHGACWRGVS